MRSGDEKTTRRYSPVDNEYKLTAIGTTFYSRLKCSFVVQISILITQRKREDLSLNNDKSTEMPLNPTAQQRTAKIKDVVSAKLNLDEPNPCAR